jgi:hypothetical protein
MLSVKFKMSNAAIPAECLGGVIEIDCRKAFETGRHVGCIPCTTNNHCWDEKLFLLVLTVAYDVNALVRKTHPATAKPGRVHSMHHV